MYNWWRTKLRKRSRKTKVEIDKKDYFLLIQALFHWKCNHTLPSFCWNESYHIINRLNSFQLFFCLIYFTFHHYSRYLLLISFTQIVFQSSNIQALSQVSDCSDLVSSLRLLLLGLKSSIMLWLQTLLWGFTISR